MTTIDIIIAIILIYAVITGFREGIIIQACSMVGIVAGIVLGLRYGTIAATLFGISNQYNYIWGFIIVLILAVIAINVAANLARRVIHFAGFGLLDAMLGVTLSLFKYLLILSLLFSAFDMVNSSFNIIPPQNLAKSTLYRPITNLSRWITPALEWGQQKAIRY
ncbi:MAG: CvpA family protein [Rikenellaceae bacterium]